MSSASDQQREEFRKRLTHLAIREVIGGDSPPDLSDRILAAAEKQTFEQPRPKGEEVMEKPHDGHSVRWLLGATACAAGLLFVAILSIQGSRARSLANLDKNETPLVEEKAPPASNAIRSAKSRNVPGWCAIEKNAKQPVPWDTAQSPTGVARGNSGYFEYAEGPVGPNAIMEAKSGTSGPVVLDPSGQTPTLNKSPCLPGVKPEMPSDSGPFEAFRPLNPKTVETKPRTFSFSAGVNSEGGLIGSVVVDEENFDSLRPGYAAQQNTSRDLAVSADGKALTVSAGNGDTRSRKERELEGARNHVTAWRNELERLNKEIRSIAPASHGGDRAAARGLLERRAEAAANALQEAIKLQHKLELEAGQGPGRGGDQYVRIVENPFRAVKDHPLSTFSIDVDTASYANVRRFLLQENQLPPPDAVRIEEMVNYFDYDYSGPTDDVPFASHIEVAGCPWAPEHRLVRIALKGYEIDTNQRPKSNLVFLLDVSGSMSSNDKLPLLQKGMKLLAGQLGKTDRVAIVVYAGSEGLVLPSTPGDERAKVLNAIDRLHSGGSTNGGAGIELAYKTALENFIEDGVNRVVLCTDGDFNVGTTSTAALERMVEEKAKSGVFLSVLGFGRGNLNDAMMETISNKGNGNYAYIDGLTEAQKVLVEQMGGTLVTIAKDVKIQVEFNPAQVEAYRLIGYENRMLAAEDFNDDKKDAGEIGAGHTVTALYELVPAGGKVDLPDVDPLRYQAGPSKNANEDVAGELLTLKLRYKEPDGDTSELLEFPTTDGGGAFSKASPDFQFVAAVASFGMLLRGSAYQGMSSYDAVQEIAESAKGADKHGYRAEFVEMVKRAKPHGERRAALLEEAQSAHEAARELAERAKPGDGLQGVVLAAADAGLVEISLGSDDGVLKGRVLDVYHSTDEASYVGSIEVVDTKPDKAVCKVLPRLRKGVIQVSDRVVAQAVHE